MDIHRLPDLLAPFLAACQPGLPKPASLAESQLKQTSTYIDLLLHWNARINLTAVRRPEEIVTRHFGESFFAARHLFPEDAGNHAGGSTNPPRVTDFGSGAGFPGLPIKIWAPFIRLTLIESNQKKATFLREAARALKLTDVDVSTEHVQFVPRRPPRSQAADPEPERLPQACADVVTLRAVEKFEAALPAAASLLSPAGCLALLIGEAQVEIAHAQLPGFRWPDPLPIPGSTPSGSAAGFPNRRAVTNLDNRWSWTTVPIAGLLVRSPPFPHFGTTKWEELFAPDAPWLSPPTHWA